MTRKNYEEAQRNTTSVLTELIYNLVHRFIGLFIQYRQLRKCSLQEQETSEKAKLQIYSPEKGPKS